MVCRAKRNQQCSWLRQILQPLKSCSLTNAAPGVYTFYSTTDNPHASIVTDQDFNDNSIPQASFSITIVPEPTTLALLAVAGAGVGLLTYRRWRATR